MIRYECRHANRLSPNAFIDASAAKFSMDNLSLDIGSLSGYLQDTSLNPFGFLLISGLQVRVLDLVK